MDDQAQHVFLSYVHENSDQIDTLCRVLEAAHVPYWRDRASLAPGDTWKARIRSAIQSGALVFLACFSDASRAKEKSYMNEELTLAVEEFRKMPPGRTWLIPVRLDDGVLPEWDLGGGQMLSDLQRVDFFGSDRAVATAALVSTIMSLLGDGPPPATTLAAIEELSTAERPAGMRRSTKEMLPDPARRIQLDDLISAEVRHVLDAMGDETRFPTQALPGTGNEQLLALAELATGLWQLVEPFCWSLQVAARFAPAETLGPWTDGLRALAAAANRPRGGRTDLLNLQGIPALMATFTAALACVGQGRWDNLKTFLIDTTAPESVYRSTSRVPLVDAVDPWPFRHADDLAPNVLARTVVTGKDPAEALSILVNRQAGRYRSPVPEWMHAVLRPVFAEQFFTEFDYSRAFDRTEVMLGLLSQDQDELAAAVHPDRAWGRGSRWFGRSTWRAGMGEYNALAEIQEELTAQAPTWEPLRAGLFGAVLQRAHDASAKYAEAFNDASWRRS